jgi:predicted amidohydrolase YtcJ
VVPGFVDAHAHPLMYGQMMTWVDCGPERAGSIAAVVALLEAGAARATPGRARAGDR